MEELNECQEEEKVQSKVSSNISKAISLDIGVDDNFHKFTAPRKVSNNHFSSISSNNLKLGL